MSTTNTSWTLAKDLTFQNGPDVDRSVWQSPQWQPQNNPAYFGRTGIRNIHDFGTPVGCVPVINNAAQLYLSTYNPQSQPAASAFLGAQISTIQQWGLASYSAVAFEASVLSPVNMPGGGVTSFFTYNLLSADPFLHDEIDFEFSSNWWKGANEAINTNIYVASNNGIDQVLASAVDFSQWITFRIEWSATGINWYINGNLFRTATQVPQSDMSMVFNFWAPDPGWGWAYNGSLNPSGAPGTQWTYQVQWAKVWIKN